VKPPQVDQIVTGGDIYEDREAKARFKEKFDRFKQQRSASAGDILNVPLVVTTTSLTPLTAVRAGEKERRLPPGPLHVCIFDDQERCLSGTNGPFLHVSPLTRGDKSNVVIDAVFASAAPFPIFPAQAVTIGGTGSLLGQQEWLEVSGDLIDGGFAHNVPIDAAASIGASQVLIIRGTPSETVTDEVEVPLVGRLVQGFGRLAGLMFNLSQRVDNLSAGRLVVASIAPSYERSAAPFLTDFRQSVIDQQLNYAEKDWTERVGRVESWGLPSFHHKIIAPVNDQVATALGRAIALKPRGGGVAVFDFDNTSIKNDIGDALFLYMLLTSSFRGDLSEFWTLF
jgi:hypothetical protein